MDPEKDKSKVKPPKTYKEQVELYKSRHLYIEDSEYLSERSLQCGRVKEVPLSECTYTCSCGPSIGVIALA